MQNKPTVGSISLYVVGRMRYAVCGVWKKYNWYKGEIVIVSYTSVDTIIWTTLSSYVRDYHKLIHLNLNSNAIDERRDETRNE